MAYLGTGVEHSADDTLAKDKDIINRTLNTMTGDNSDTTLTLSMTPASVNNVDVYLDGVRQRPTTDYTVSGTTLTFTTAPPTGVVVIALTGSAEPIGITTESFPGSDFETITDAKIASGIASSKLTGALPALNGSNLTSLPAGNLTGTVADARISTLTASKLSGALPAIDGSNLTNLPPGFTKNSSDPAITTNPSGGVGTVWVNTTSGEAFVCTDATSNENVWTNVGGGTGDVQPVPFYQGTNYGYIAGGGYPNNNIIDRNSFTSDGNSSDWADLSGSYNYLTGTSSTTNGYACGNESANIMQKFPFASQTNASEIGDMASNTYGAAGCSSTTHGYYCGDGSPTTNVIQKVSFSTDGNSQDVANMTASFGFGTGSQSQTYGYIAGGHSPYRNGIEKFQFATDGDATDVADLTNTVTQCGGNSSINYGYASGGYTPTLQNVINKYSFTSDSNATDVGDIIAAKRQCSGTDSSTHGYLSGGYISSGSNVVEKFSFTTDGNSTDVGDMTSTRNHPAGCQY